MHRSALLISVVAAACSRDPGAAAPALTANRPGPSAIASTCTTPFEVAPLHPDTFVDQAVAAAPTAGGAWSTSALMGPSPAVAADCTERARVPAIAPFLEIVQCATGDPQRPLGPDNIPEHRLALRTARGWWTTTLVREFWPHGPDDEPRVADVSQLTAQDRLGDGGAEITALTEDGPPGRSKRRTASVCGVGPSGVPSCARVVVAAGGPFHGEGALVYRLTLACDGTLDVAGWQGGATVGLVHGRYTLAFP